MVDKPRMRLESGIWRDSLLWFQSGMSPPTFFLASARDNYPFWNSKAFMQVFPDLLKRME